MSEAPAEPIEFPAHDDIQLSALRVGHELVESWPAVLRTADARIDVFGWLPVARLAVAAQLATAAIANPMNYASMIGGCVPRGLT